MAADPKLPEEFAPTGPKLSRFPIRPAPPIRPHLFPDEARFTLRLALLVAATEFVAWAWLASGHLPPRWLLALAAIRLLRPLWSKAGTHAPRAAVALTLLAAAILGATAPFLAARPWSGVAFVAVGLPALGDLCASCITDAVTVERRPAAYAWIDMAQGLGGALGVGLGPLGALASVPVLLVSAVSLSALRDRGTPRSTWPLAAYGSALRAPLGAHLTALSFAAGALARLQPAEWGWRSAVLLLGGMALAARAERWMPNAIWMPRIATALAAAGWAFPPLRLAAIGAMFAAIPAAVARGAGEMERPLVSSLAWSALFAGAAAGALLPAVLGS